MGFYSLLFQCFKIFGFSEEERKTWQAARKACIGFKGNLVSIQNEKEQGMQIIFKSVINLNMQVCQ
jgi:C-type mannose receptor